MKKFLNDTVISELSSVQQVSKKSLVARDSKLKLNHEINFSSDLFSNCLWCSL